MWCEWSVLRAVMKFINKRERERRTRQRVERVETGSDKEAKGDIAGIDKRCEHDGPRWHK